MDKILINLNPQKEKISSDALEKVTVYTPLLILVAVVGIILILFLQFFSLLRMHKYNSYTKLWKQWANKASLIKETKREIKVLEEEKNRLIAVVTPKYQATLILENIYSSLPRNIWLKEIVLKGAATNLEGYVVKWKKDYLSSLDSFVGSLSKKEYFSSKFGLINIQTSKKEYFNNIEVLYFKIECKN